LIIDKASRRKRNRFNFNRFCADVQPREANVKKFAKFRENAKILPPSRLETAVAPKKNFRKNEEKPGKTIATARRIWYNERKERRGDVDLSSARIFDVNGIFYRLYQAIEDFKWII
jgi:hypothetical protein